MIEGAKKCTGAAHNEISITIEELPMDAAAFRQRLGDNANIYQSIDGGLGVALKSISEPGSEGTSS